MIGDIHGQYGALRRLDRRLPREAERIFVGDLFDRGPQSREVYKFLRDLPHRRVRGNHDQILLDVLTGRLGAMEIRTWLYDVGGAETMRSFGDSISPDLLGFLAAAPLYIKTDGLLVVHAGIAPGIPLERQHREDLLWIREEFYEAPDHGYPGTVVFGHTPFAEVFVGQGRVGCDTGAGLGRQLSAVLFEGDVLVGTLSEPV